MSRRPEDGVVGRVRRRLSTSPLEGGMSPDDIKSLKGSGHEVVVHPGRVFGGSAKMIVIDPEPGVRMAGSDPRSDGQAGAV